VEEELLTKGYDRRLMLRLLRYAWPYRHAVAVSVVFLLVASVMQILGPLLTKLAVDRYLTPGAIGEPFTTPIDGWLSADPGTGITQIALLYLATIVIGMFGEFGQTFLMQRTGQYAMFDLRRELIRHLQKLDLSYYDRNPVGRMVTRVTTDVDALNELFASGLVAIVGDIVVLGLLLAVMFQMSAGMTLIMLAVMPFVLIATIVFRRTVQQSYRRIRLAVARINSYVQEHVTGIAVVQLFNAEEKSKGEFDGANRDHLDAYKESINAYGWFYPVVEFLAMLALACLLAYGGFQIAGGELTYGALVAFFQYGVRFFRPIQDLSEKYNIMQAAMAASERVFGLLDIKPAVVNKPETVPFPAGPASVEFDNVWFAYKGEDWVLKDVSFRIEPGEMIAVVGHTGAGKTTLTNLLLRFYDIQRGAIRIQGRDIRDLDLRDLRRQFSIVLQDPFLFTGTPKSQSALLEAMEEHQVTTDGLTRPLPEPFFVIATQNPSTQMGTFPLPESQLDRFLMRIELGYPEPDAERELLRGGDRRRVLGEVRPLADAAQVQLIQQAVDDVKVSDPLIEYVQRLVARSRSGREFAFGLSPRGALALLQAARAWALIHDRSHVVPEDVQAVLPAVVEHRLRAAADHAGHGGAALAQRLLSGVDVIG
jgi:ATP-binding cassette, subfamily B, multidrug efflux pump